MEDCIAQVKPILVLHRRRRRLIRPPLMPPKAQLELRLGLLQFWRQAQLRHIQARIEWRNKLNRYLVP
ncbi:MAG: hypothetical protein NVV73_01825 [Cellvibrionaceae bacterium]|nr:hypothetical protein [Cellvibrionaceae bacterium]